MPPSHTESTRKDLQMNIQPLQQGRVSSVMLIACLLYFPPHAVLQSLTIIPNLQIKALGGWVANLSKDSQPPNLASNSSEYGKLSGRT